MTTDTCPRCGSPLKPVETTPSGKKLQRCSKGSWNPTTRQSEGCDYVNWIQDPPQELDEKCPLCGKNLIMQTTRMGKKMKKCSGGGWDREAKKATGCTYVDWMDKPEQLNEECPQCGAKLIMMTTRNGKKLKKCSTSKWDPKSKVASGCTYTEWVNANTASNGDESAPEFEQ